MAEEKKDEATKPAAPAAPASGKKGGNMGFFLIMILFGASVPVLLPTWTLLLVGMVPTIIVLFTDSDKNRTGSVSVGFMNAAGVVPFILDLWMKGQTMQNAFQILREPLSWFVMFGAAGIGQLIVFAMPQAIASMTMARSETRLKILRQNLETLRNAWGPDVATTKPIDKIGRAD